MTSPTWREGDPLKSICAGAVGAGIVMALFWGRFCFGAQFNGRSLRLSTPASKVAVLIRGESFRFGGQRSRYVGVKESIAPQFEAVKSQVRYLLAPLQENGFIVRIYLAIGHGGKEELYQQLKAMYAAEVVAVEDVPQKESHQTVGPYEQRNVSTKKAQCRTLTCKYPPESRTIGAAASLYFKSAERRAEHADYFIILRPDVILKQDIFRLWYAHRSKVAFTFPEVCIADTVRGCHGLVPGQKCHRVPDMIVSVPYLAFRTVWRYKILQGQFGHFIYRELVNTGFPADNVSFWTHPGYDADPEKDANPLYRLAGRPEQSILNVSWCRHKSATVPGVPP